MNVYVLIGVSSNGNEKVLDVYVNVNEALEKVASEKANYFYVRCEVKQLIGQTVFNG